MRLRHVTGAEEKLQTSPLVVQKPAEWKGNWKTFFGNSHPVFLEIGMGKGRFITEMAQNHREYNFIGIEKYPSVLVRALEKRTEEDSLQNLYYLNVDACILSEIFGEGEVEGIYLNFSDPWPKERHAKRRLTSPEFLAGYQNYLSKEGVVSFKTDNQPLFSYSLETAKKQGWRIVSATTDLHNDPEMNKGNVMTEYEEKFAGMGHPICKMVIAMP